jgi:hypothetical protein
MRFAELARGAFVDSLQIGSAAEDGRISSRTNMYIAAIVSSQEGSSSAKIRNMSATGALAETSIVPDVGSLVRLVRGSLSVEGRIAWATAGRCGIRFNSLVAVNEWMSPTTNRVQNQVDDTVALLKAGALPMSAARQNRLDDQSPITEELAIELRQISSMLNDLGSQLTEDEGVVEKFGRQLQSLDLAQQTLELAAAILINGCRASTDYGSRLQSLSASRTQAMKKAG